MTRVQFWQYVSSIDPDINDFEMNLVFKKFDLDSNGLISKDEFLQVIFTI